MDCFICKTKIFLNTANKHFRLIHFMNEKESYQCTFKNCYQYVSSRSAFVRHFKAHLNTMNSQEAQGYITESSPEISSQSLENVSYEKNSDLLMTPSIVPSTSKTYIQNTPCVDNGVAFAVRMHKNSNFTRKDVLSVQKNVMKNIINPIVEDFKQFINQNFSIDVEQAMAISSFIKRIENPFENCESEYFLFKWLKDNNFICDYKEFSINNEIGQVYQHGQMRYNESNTTGVLFPISFQFKKIFEFNDTLTHTIDNINKIFNNTQMYTHFIQGELWRNKTKEYIASGKTVIPYFLYIDDAETNNPLGSHCDPITFVYYSFPVIENSEIYTAALIRSRDYKEFGNEKCFKALIEEMIKLEEEGINIVTSDGEKQVYFVLGLILGDNLGLNTALGFVSSFSANFFCRFCKDTKISTQAAVDIKPNLLRNIQNYNDDIVANDFSITGIKENCVFNQINSFHSTSNYSIDVMHDIFEGVCHYNMCHIIQKLIEKNYFDLNKLNERKLSFNYGEIEIGNISREITANNLKHFHLKMTAREMMAFVHLFPLMVGDLVKNDDEIWSFLLRFLEIIEILLYFEISRDILEKLKYLIKCHHADYIKLFNDTLKPKHHLMLHYYNIILQSGPPRLFWCFRYEANHQPHKAYAREINSRKNMCTSLAKKYQLRFAYSLIEPSVLTFEVQECHRIPTAHNGLISSFCELKNINLNYVAYNQCKYRCKTYKIGYCVSQFIDINVENTIIFKIVEIILLTGQAKPQVICKQLKVKEYLKHFKSYQIDMLSEEQLFKILPIDFFNGPPVNIHETVNGLNLIRPKLNFIDN